MMKIPNDHWLRNRPIAHRGIYNNKYIIENSKEAFRKASLLDYPIELDVQITKYHTVIVYHDNNIKRLTGINKNCYDLTEDDLKNIKYHNTNSHITTLEETLNLIAGKVPILIEIKYQLNYWIMKDLVKNCYKILSKYKGDYAIQSFNPFIYKLCRKFNWRAYIGLIGPIKLFNYKILFTRLLKKHYHFLVYNIKELPNDEVSRLPILKLYWNVTNKQDEEKAIQNNGNFIWSNNKNKGYYPPRVITCASKDNK